MLYKELCSLTLAVFPVRDIFEVVDSGVVVVLTREHNLVQVARMSVRNWVSWMVSLRLSSDILKDLLLVSHLPKPVSLLVFILTPSDCPRTHIKTAHEHNLSVDNN